MSTKVAAACRLCGKDESFEVYRGPVRAGKPGQSADGHRVLECRHCGAQRLDPQPEDALAAYADGSYRASYDGSAKVADFYKNHGAEQPRKLALLGEERARARAIADAGCGAGAFLDLLKGKASRLVAVEPDASFHEHLKSRHDAVYSDDAALAAAEPGALDVVTGFAVVEHVSNPLSFVKNLAAALKPGGRLLLTTPNRGEILMRLHAERFRPFFYRTAHLWYFDAASLAGLGERAGLRVLRQGCFHTYDFSNFALWLRDGKPTGLGAAKEFGPELDAAWKARLESQGWADQLFAEFGRAS